MSRNRTLPHHLERRRSGYFWRRRWPRAFLLKLDCTPSISSSFCLSLRTHVLSDAKILARRLTEMSDLVFAADAEKVMAIAPDTQCSMLEALARFEIEAFERARAVAGPRSPEAAIVELRREEAIQSTLRQALYLGDREVAQRPLRHVAAQLRLELDEADEDWTALAYEATKVLLDVSHERVRRQQGIYNEPTVYFRRAVSTFGPNTATHLKTPINVGVAPSTLASTYAAPTSPLAEPTAPREPDVPEAQAPISPASHVLTEEATAAPTTIGTSLVDVTSPSPIVLPAGFDLPAGYDEEGWQEARVAARPPRILVDQKLLSERCRSALAKKRGISLTEAIELYFELLSWGYSAPFSAHQKRKRGPASANGASLEQRLCEDHRGKRRLALDFWPAALGDEPVDEISVDELNDALERFWRVPANHGKSPKDRDTHNLIELIEKADAKSAQVDSAVAAAKTRGARAEEIDKLRLEGHQPRLSVTTYVKHARVLRAIGDMLMDMQLIDQNPFSICCWSNADVKALRSKEGKQRREAWDDRIDKLFGSPVYKEPLVDIGEPLFWAPLIARHQGMRMEEILQLGPNDFGSDKGIPYLRVRHTIINGLKTLSSERVLPIHSQLIELGLLKLVELRKKDGHIRLFPFLTRGKHKGTFSANFSKCFGYYRRTNDCYWPGLDFHALRTTFHHDLLADDKSDAIRCRLMGHAYNDEGDESYGQNLGIGALAKRMESVVVNISMVRRPFDTSGAAIKSRAVERGLRVV